MCVFAPGLSAWGMFNSYWSESGFCCRVIVVGRGGLEPPWITPLAPKASASANFAIYPLIDTRDAPESRFVPSGSLPEGARIPFKKRILERMNIV